MSFVYNQKEVFRGCSTKSVDFMLSNKLANFYLNNSNPNRQDIEQFCKEADFDFNSAVSYIKERKMQDIRNRNLVFMKFGREYIQPSTEQVKEYENSLTSGDLEFSAVTAENQNNFIKLLNQNNSTNNFSNKNAESERDSDLLLDEIPKKAQSSSISKANNTLNNHNSNNYNNIDYKNKDFFESESTIKINKKLTQNQNQNQKTSPIKHTKSAAGSTDNSDSEALSSSASLGRLFNNYYQHSFLPSGIQDTKLIHSLILFMKKDLKLELKHEVSITLARTSNPLVLQRFLEFEGAEILSNWLHEIKEKIQDLPNYSASASQNYLNNILLNLLIFCEKLKISLKDLKFSKIGKEVNKLAKLNLDNKEIHSKCVALVNKWKKIVEETKEGKKLEASASSGLESAVPLKNEEKRSKKADMTQSLLKGILTEEAEKPVVEVAARGLDAEQDRVAVEMLNRKRHHTDKDKDKDREREREKDRLRERDREESSFNAHDKNNKKFKREESNFDLENQKRKEKEVQQQQQQQQTVPFDLNRNIINKGFIPNLPMPNNFVYNTIPLGAPIQNPALSAVTQKKGPLKGILKTSSTSQASGALKKDAKKLNAEKKRIKFEHDMVLEKVKVFKLTDEVNAPNISEEEYQKIQQELLKDPTRSFLGDMKFRESHMEKENLLREKEKAKMAKEMFEKMTPEIKITRPLEIYIESPYEEGEEIDKELVSEEKEQIEQFLNKILMTTYFRESDIPPTPKMGKSEMFEFFDENIPKIENLKKSFDSEKPIYEVDFSKIDHIESNPELLKSLAERINNAELSIQSEEEKNKLLAILQNQMKKTEESNKIGTNNSINPIITQLPNLLPTNAINPLNPLAAGNMINNMKMNPNSMGNPTPPNIPNQMFPPIQPMGMGPMPMVPPFNQMNNMMNPNNMMNMNNMNLIKNNMSFPNNPNFNMPNNPNMINPMMKNMPNNMNMNSNFMNQNNMMNKPGNKMNMNYNFNSNNLNFNNNENRNNFNNQDNRQINFNRIKTKPCRNYHGVVGCPRGDDCYFIHDQENQGRDIPEPRLAEIAKTNTENANNYYNNNNQNNSFYNNNVQNNRFRNYRNFNNRNSNFSNNRFNQNPQGNFPSSDANSTNNGKEESWGNSNNNPSGDDPNIDMNIDNNYNENQSANENENKNGSNDFNQDVMEVEARENIDNEESNNNDLGNDYENESGFAEEGNLLHNPNSNNNNGFKSFNSGFNHQNNFYNHNNNGNNNFNNNLYYRNKGHMHQRNFHNRNFNSNRMNNYNKNMNYNNNNNNSDNQNNSFPGQQNFNNQQQQYYNMMQQQQNKLNANMPFNNNQNSNNAGFRSNFTDSI